jgi:hypothetical protein
MQDFFHANDQLPPSAFVAAVFDKHDNQIYEMFLGFERRGMIERNAVGKWRFTRGQV